MKTDIEINQQQTNKDENKKSTVIIQQTKYIVIYYINKLNCDDHNKDVEFKLKNFFFNFHCILISSAI